MLSWLWDHHQILLQQCFSLPFGFLFYVLAKHGHLSLKYRYTYMCVGGCVLAIITMGMYSALLFSSVFIFIVLVCTVDLNYIHTWVFILQMSWQTFWHIFLQYKEYYLPEHVNSSLLLAISALMLITQRVTSVSMDLQDRRLLLPLNTSSLNETFAGLLPVISYILNFTTLLGGPLCSYGYFVSFIKGIDVNPPPNPLRVVCLKLMQVFLLECLRYCFVCMLKFIPNLNIVSAVLSVWALGVVLRLHYYAHWRISECLNNAAGLGFWATSKSPCPNWSGLSDGDFWIIESSIQISNLSRRWNATTAAWLRSQVYMRCHYFPLLMTFGFSLWWHGLRVGHCLAFFIWTATVKADHYICKNWLPKPSSAWWKAACVTLSWINTQVIITCIVIATELRFVSVVETMHIVWGNQRKSLVK